MYAWVIHLQKLTPQAALREPVMETVVAVRLLVLSMSDEVPEILRAPVTVLVKVRRQVWR